MTGSIWETFAIFNTKLLGNNLEVFGSIPTGPTFLIKHLQIKNVSVFYFTSGTLVFKKMRCFDQRD